MFEESGNRWNAASFSWGKSLLPPDTRAGRVCDKIAENPPPNTRSTFCAGCVT